VADDDQRNPALGERSAERHEVAAEEADLRAPPVVLAPLVGRADEERVHGTAAVQRDIERDIVGDAKVAAEPDECAGMRHGGTRRVSRYARDQVSKQK